jgi:biopolymer transport protein ExbD
MKTFKSIAFFTLGILTAFSWVIGAENKNARELGEKELAKYVIKCGDSRYYKRVIAGVIEMKNIGSTSLRELFLNESDKLNGYEYEGVLTYSYYGPEREQIGKSGGWSEWSQARFIIDINIICKSSVWTANKTGDLFRGATYVGLSCNDIPGYEPTIKADPKYGIYINMHENGEMELNNIEIKPDSLYGKLKDLLIKESLKKKAYLNHETDIRMGDLLEILERIRAAGINNLVLSASGWPDMAEEVILPEVSGGENKIDSSSSIIYAPVDIPMGTDPKEPIVLTVRKNRVIYINQMNFDDENFESKLKSIYSTRSDKTLFVRADMSEYLGYVIKIISIAKRVGVKTIGMLPEYISEMP